MKIRQRKPRANRRGVSGKLPDFTPIHISEWVRQEQGAVSGRRRAGEGTAKQRRAHVFLALAVGPHIQNAIVESLGFGDLLS